MNIKKLIAREGLIFIGVMLLGSLILLISSVYPPYFKPQKTREAIVFTKEQFATLKNKGLTLEQIVMLSKGQLPIDIETKVKLKEPLTDEDVEKLDRIDKARAELDRRTEEKRSKIKDVGFSFLFTTYFIYLVLIKFILWAIKTLKQKERKI